MTTSVAEIELRVPAELPYRRLEPLEMLSRYEAGWRYLGVLGEPSPEE